MSDTQRTLFNKRARSLCIAGAFLLLVTLVFAFLTPPPIETQSVKVIEPPHPRRVRLAYPAVFETEAFYRTIIDNNLFRPLGWTPPRPVEPYRLVGTRIGRDDNTPAQAILEKTGSHSPLIVSIGDMLDASTEVVGVAGKSVVLETAGKKRTLRLQAGVWLKSSRATRLPVRQQAAVNPPSVRSPRVASLVSRSSSRPPSDPMPARPLSEWQTSAGEPIRLGDARLKNPAKWGLRR
jgi:hypothetical protein